MNTAYGGRVVATKHEQPSSGLVAQIIHPGSNYILIQNKGPKVQIKKKSERTQAEMLRSLQAF